MLLLIASTYVILKSISNESYRKTIKYRFTLSQDEPVLKEFKNQQKKSSFSGLWIHAASVGEVLGAVNLISKIRQEYENYPIFLTVTNYAALKLIREKYHYINVRISPLDFSWLISRLCSILQVPNIIIVEAEYWPNLIDIFSKHGRIFHVSTRFSKKALNRYKNFNFLFKNTFSKITAFFTKTEEDNNNLIKYGINENKVFTVGDIKAYQSYKDFCSEESIFDLVAGSTHKGEESVLINLYLKFEKNISLAIAPRHLSRLNEIIAELKRNDINFLLWSKDKDFIKRNQNQKSIVLIDTMGELSDIYALGKIGFVGGTLQKIGGHNLFEPAICSRPVLFGKYYQRQSFMADTLLKENKEISNNTYKGAYVVESLDQFYDLVKYLLQNNNWLEEGKIARKKFEYASHSLERTYNLLKDKFNVFV
ncbi:3-deoxy-D-manno-octulosonic acid transferase [Thermodesulfobium narugense]|uniref:3-deoxy-D-manno-octulosonic acid transferase n=1 Tax=Thermodesulfobium narugense TaxID=184064 RepID=UPI00145FCA9A|nr:glycosyltransferase N-terminal domain-containing protein [Thermodesulfobium narugense]